MIEALPLVLGSVRSEFTSMLEGADRRPEIRIVPAALGEHAGAVGAALVARHDHRYGAELERAEPGR
jgi:ROK family